jgi:hypothetical protein
VKGRLHLIEKLDHVFKLQDGSGLWASGYWELTADERSQVREVFLHATKSKPSRFGGRVVETRSASDFPDQARRHSTDPEGRWVFILNASAEYKGLEWEGADYAMAYKSLV